VPTPVRGAVEVEAVLSEINFDGTTTCRPAGCKRRPMIAPAEMTGKRARRRVALGLFVAALMLVSLSLGTGQLVSLLQSTESGREILIRVRTLADQATDALTFNGDNKTGADRESRPGR
jgi:hypothetical protein